MTFYNELQLNAQGSKNLIRSSTDKKEKMRHILIYNLKVYLVVAFCFLFVSLLSSVIGAENSIIAVVILLAILVLRQADFGIRTSHGILVIGILFGILTFGSRLSNMVPPVPAFLINICCILGILLFGCHNIIMYNQSTFVLCYLLMQGYDVSGEAYRNRVVVMMMGMVVCAIIFYAKHRKQHMKRTFLDLFREFDLFSTRSRWYLRLTIGISSAMLIVSALQLPRAMWAGIAVMSVMAPFSADCAFRTKRRAPFNIIGCCLFAILYNVLPPQIVPYIGLIGGVGTGFSATYAWQTLFNTFGALSIAASQFGLKEAIILRICMNAFGSLYGFTVNFIFDKIKARVPVKAY
ncbi:MAG: FUSC family protein [Agathobacter sp.]